MAAAAFEPLPPASPPPLPVRRRARSRMSPDWRDGERRAREDLAAARQSSPLAPIPNNAARVAPGEGLPPSPDPFAPHGVDPRPSQPPFSAPAVPPLDPDPSKLRCVSVNVRGWAANHVEVLARARQLHVDVVLLQETLLRPEHIIVAPGWQVFRRDRTMPVTRGEEARGGGLLVLVRRGLAAGILDVRESDDAAGCVTAMERLDVTVGRPGLPTLHLCVIYRPPVGSARADTRPTAFPVQSFPTGPHVLLVGDFNAHHECWDSFVPRDAVGDTLRGWCAEEGMHAWNDPLIPTRHTIDLHDGTAASALTVRALRSEIKRCGVPPAFVKERTQDERTMSTARHSELARVVSDWRALFSADESHEALDGDGVVASDLRPAAFRDRRSSPDLVISNAAWDTGSWRVLDRWGSSDHLPMFFEVPAGGAPRSGVKWREVDDWERCDWDRLIAGLEGVAGKVLRQRRCEYANAKFSYHIRRLVAECVPKRRVKCRTFAKPWWRDELIPLFDARDAAWRRLNECGAAATPADWATLQAARECVREAVADRKRDWLNRLVEQCDMRTSPAAMFRALRVLEGGFSEPPSPPLLIDGEYVYDDEGKAEALAACFAETRRLPPDDDVTWQEVLQDIPEGAGMTEEANAAFAPHELDRVLKSVDVTKGAGPDGIRNAVLHRLGPKATRALLHVCNLSWREGVLPSEWREELIVPLPKPKKPLSQVGSYRPIALTSWVAKVMERMVASRRKYLLEADDTGVQQLHADQAGFRSLRSTDEHVGHVIGTLKSARREKRHACLLCFDLTKAFDMMDVAKLGALLARRGFRGRTLAWLQNFARRRRGRVRVGGASSDATEYLRGSPQGTISSPDLFAMYMDDVPRALGSGRDGVHVSLYADDVAVTITANTPDELRRTAQGVVDAMRRWAETWGMCISADKTTVTWLARRGAAAWPPLFIDAAQERAVKVDANPRFLGVTLCADLRFDAHVERVSAAFTKRLCVLRRVASPRWGCSKQSLWQLYVAFVLPVLQYCQAEWWFCLTQAARDRLESLHLAGARAVAGLRRSTAAVDVLREANLLPMSTLAKDRAIANFEKRMRMAGTTGCAASIAFSHLPGTAAHVGHVWWMDTLRRKAPLREPLRVVGALPPWRDVSAVTVRPRIEGFRKKDSTLEECLAAADRAMASLPPASVHLYTDGAANAAAMNGAAGFYVVIDGWEHEDGALAAKYCSSTQAERTALVTGLEFVRDELRRRGARGRRVHVFSDSQPALFNVAAGPSVGGTETTVQIWRVLGALLDDGHAVDLQYVPSHVGVAGNERADVMADTYCVAEAANRKGIPLDHSTVKAMVKKDLRRDWLSDVDATRELSKILGAKSSLVPWDEDFPPVPPKYSGFAPMGHAALRRAGEAVIAKLRTRHHPLLIDVVGASVRGHLPPAPCPDCSGAASLQHICFACPARPSLWCEAVAGFTLRDLTCTRPQVLLEYLWSKGWIGGRRSDLFSSPYLATVPESPFATLIDWDCHEWYVHGSEL